ncbi:pentapeptide repeat-containing protein [Streptomyces sp. NBC_00439]|uniref:pentapeptide repeat-containing protein n=1 Tax=Streptomyces sp. NBC_00439 TaxID=2903650 RepID=UPI002259E3F5|nr:pentapeptide repeat-containing protein [Streptomyces sp. NBC_00439]MCX5106918.1 pentapeptide repeat-containing protein [Streptomyces sp. NBC_00439]
MPGSDLDHRGTPISENLLQQLLDAVRDPATGQPCLGNTRFDGATFSGGTSFGGATFTGRAEFREATFTGLAMFAGVTFSSDAWFERATFTNDAWFVRATFTGLAVFIAAKFHRDGWFTNTAFEATTELGPLICAGFVQLSGAVFGGPVTIAVAATTLGCRRTRWASTAALRLRYATVDLSDAVFEYPLSIIARAFPFTDWLGGDVAEELLAGSNPGVRIASLRGADAAHLVLQDVDLRACLMSGTVHLDQLRLEGECPLAPAPSRLWRRGLRVMRWTARRTLAEEQHWRAAMGGTGWTAAPTGVEVLSPAQLGSVFGCDQGAARVRSLIQIMEARRWSPAR